MSTNAILAFMAIVGLVVFFYGPWQSLCVDVARQLLFEQRAKLFDLALNGKIQFNSDRYRKIRKSLEGSIRFAHDLTVPRMIYLALVYRIPNRRKSDLREAIEQIEDESVRIEINAIANQATKIMIALALARSVITIAAIPLLVVVIGLAMIFDLARITMVLCAKTVGDIAQKEAEMCV